MAKKLFLFVLLIAATAATIYFPFFYGKNDAEGEELNIGLGEGEIAIDIGTPVASDDAPAANRDRPTAIKAPERTAERQTGKKPSADLASSITLESEAKAADQLRIDKDPLKPAKNEAEQHASVQDAPAPSDKESAAKDESEKRAMEPADIVAEFQKRLPMDVSKQMKLVNFSYSDKTGFVYTLKTTDPKIAKQFETGMAEKSCAHKQVRQLLSLSRKVNFDLVDKSGSRLASVTVNRDLCAKFAK